MYGPELADGGSIAPLGDSSVIDILEGGMMMAASPTSIMTFTGKVFEWNDPKPESICIEDIAHALALTNRYGGHTCVQYSVAEHSVRCSHITYAEPLILLLHDAAEAYLGDIPTPLKRYMNFTSHMVRVRYKDIELKVLDVIGDALGVAGLAEEVASPAVKHVDRIMLATETRDLMDPRWPNICNLSGIVPLEETIYPWNWKESEQAFLDRYYELRG